jgi:hypothetical protein
VKAPFALAVSLRFVSSCDQVSDGHVGAVRRHKAKYETIGADRAMTWKVPADLTCARVNDDEFV